MTFKNKGTFKALNAAQSYARSNGYIYGSLCGNSPIALRKGNSFLDYNLPEKWKNFSTDDINSIDGKIISNDFREGPVTVIFYK